MDPITTIITGVISVVAGLFAGSFFDGWRGTAAYFLGAFLMFVIISAWTNSLHG